MRPVDRIPMPTMRPGRVSDPRDSSSVTEDLSEFVFPSNNDAYHEKLLTLLKINNNKPLNALYYNVVPRISKGSLLMLDLSAMLTVLFCMQVPS